MITLRPLFCLLAASLVGCGGAGGLGQGEATAQAVAAGVTWSSDALFGSYEKQSSGAYFAQSVASVTALPLDFLSGVERQPSIKDFKIDGVALKGEASADLGSRLKALGQTYPTLGDFWHAHGFKASAGVSRSQFLAGIKAMSGKEKAAAAGLKAPRLSQDQATAVLAVGMILLAPLLNQQAHLLEANAASLALQGGVWSYPWGGHTPSCKEHPEFQPPRCVVITQGITTYDSVDSGVDCLEGIDPSCAVIKGIAELHNAATEGQTARVHQQAGEQSKQYLDRALQRNAIPLGQLGSCTSAIAHADVSANYKVVNRIPYTCTLTDKGYDWTFSDDDVSMP